MITLIIVDCQNDFITGSMSVKGAKNAVDNIKDFIKNHRKEIEKIIFTVDWHPYNHMSFKKSGGQWPSHCVQYTPGACIEPTILKLPWRLNIPYEIVSYWPKTIPEGTDLIIAGMNGNTSVKSAVELYWNVYRCELFWPGIWFPEHNEETFNWLRNHTEGIFEVPKRDKKKDLFVQRFKGNK